ncbi:MAG: zinc/manganese transport system substrate-binding protein [Cryptosporangiaceae bacterium]|nr:zinc/manganese transport system substrate-binding protein [Cryptosporangiaceae bacterium]
MSLKPSFTPTTGRSAGLLRIGGCAMVTAAALSACATSPSTAGPGPGARVVTVVAAENFWGSLAAQLGGTHVKVTSIIDNPDADPHDYEPAAADARAMAGAGIALVNGVGYDPWAAKLIAANPAPHRVVLTVGDVVGAKDGDNPHRWYNPGDVRTVLGQITADLKRADPADAAYFDSQYQAVLAHNLKPYLDLVDQIKAAYGGTPVGASESIFAMLAPATGLDLVTPPRFLTAISEGSDPTAQDKATIDAQIHDRKIKVYVYNSQNATPDVQAQVTAAKAAGIPVTVITETLSPAGASFEDWQVAQLTALKRALAEATGK